MFLVLILFLSSGITWYAYCFSFLLSRLQNECVVVVVWLFQSCCRLPVLASVVCQSMSPDVFSCFVFSCFCFVVIVVVAGLIFILASVFMFGFIGGVVVERIMCGDGCLNICDTSMILYYHWETNLNCRLDGWLKLEEGWQWESNTRA